MTLHQILGKEAKEGEWEVFINYHIILYFFSEVKVFDYSKLRYFRSQDSEPITNTNKVADFLTQNIRRRTERSGMVYLIEQSGTVTYFVQSQEVYTVRSMDLLTV